MQYTNSVVVLSYWIKTLDLELYGKQKVEAPEITRKQLEQQWTEITVNLTLSQPKQCPKVVSFRSYCPDYTIIFEANIPQNKVNCWLRLHINTQLITEEDGKVRIILQNNNDLRRSKVGDKKAEEIFKTVAY